MCVLPMTLSPSVLLPEYSRSYFVRPEVLAVCVRKVRNSPEVAHQVPQAPAASRPARWPPALCLPLLWLLRAT